MNITKFSLLTFVTMSVLLGFSCNKENHSESTDADLSVTNVTNSVMQYPSEDDSLMLALRRKYPDTFRKIDSTLVAERDSILQSKKHRSKLDSSKPSNTVERFMIPMNITSKPGVLPAPSWPSFVTFTFHYDSDDFGGTITHTYNLSSSNTPKSHSLSSGSVYAAYDGVRAYVMYHTAEWYWPESFGATFLLNYMSYGNIFENITEFGNPTCTATLLGAP